MQSILKLIFAVTILILCSAAFYSPPNFFKMKQDSPLKVNVWDTYVTKKDGKIMHFDIIAPAQVLDTAVIYNYGKEYLKLKGQEGQPLTSKQCRLCHMRNLIPAWEDEIKEKGYFILEMEGCN